MNYLITDDAGVSGRLFCRELRSAASMGDQDRRIAAFEGVQEITILQLAEKILLKCCYKGKLPSKLLPEDDAIQQKSDITVSGMNSFGFQKFFLTKLLKELLLTLKICNCHQALYREQFHKTFTS